MRKIVILILLFSTGYAWTQSYNTGSESVKPDLQTTEPDFFDPDQKKEQAPYVFDVLYRIQGGYIQPNQRTMNKTKADLYLHGGQVGVTFDFVLPKRFSLQTGLLYTLAYGTTKQRWAQMSAEDIYAHTDYMTYRITEHQLAIPIRLYYQIPLWKQLNLFFYTGPQLMVGLAQQNNIDNHLTAKTTAWLRENEATFHIYTEPYDRYREKELWAANIQWGLGGGIEWDSYRLQAGYDFGLNNLVRQKSISNQQMWEWNWYVSFAYRLPTHK